jgi:hypothetical protein
MSGQVAFPADVRACLICRALCSRDMREIKRRLVALRGLGLIRLEENDVKVL